MGFHIISGHRGLNKINLVADVCCVRCPVSSVHYIWCNIYIPINSIYFWRAAHRILDTKCFYSTTKSIQMIAMQHFEVFTIYLFLIAASCVPQCLMLGIKCSYTSQNPKISYQFRTLARMPNVRAQTRHWLRTYIVCRRWSWIFHFRDGGMLCYLIHDT